MFSAAVSVSVCFYMVFFVEQKDETDITVALLWRDSVQWMKIVFGNVLRAEHPAKGTGGALDQSAPAMRDALTFHRTPNLDKYLEKHHIFCA